MRVARAGSVAAMAGSYRILAHTADTGLEVEADTLGSLFEWAGRGMFELMFDLGGVDAARSIEVRVESSQVDELLVDVLSELLYVAESADVVPCRFVATEATATHVALAVGVVPVETAVLIGPPIKAVTYHDLSVERRSDGTWMAHVVFDV